MIRWVVRLAVLIILALRWVPVVLVATALGRVLNRRMAGRRYLVYVHVGLVVIGGDAPDPVGVGVGPVLT